MNTYIELAKSIREKKHPDSKFFLVAGSIIRGEGTRYSDLDIVVIYDTLHHAYRESFIFDTVMVETFVHDPETIQFFMEKIDKPNGNQSLAHMIVDGIVIPSECSLSQELKENAKTVIAEGPQKCAIQKLVNKRYAISNLIDDLREYRNDSELLGTITALYSALGEFYFMANQHWIGKDKYVSKMMKLYNPELEKAFSTAFSRAIINKEIDTVISITEEILQPFGGYLFNGYRLDAKEEMRISKM